MNTALARVLVVGLLWAAAAVARAEPEVNLLRLPQAHIDWATVAADAIPTLSPLTDGKPDTNATATATEAAPLEVVYSVGDDVAAPSAIRLTVPDSGAPGRIEVLASTVSARAGFRSLRADLVNPKQRVQSFAFPATAARWVMLRFTPAAGQSSVAAGEVELLGHPGMPTSRYTFVETPARAIDIIGKLSQSQEITAALRPDEAALFQKARAGRPDSATVTAVTLLASGVADPARRAVYERRIDALEKAARAATAAARSPEEKGELLLRWLHKGPMAKGYETNQTDISVLLDTGRFNCVSSAALYALLAQRIGLDARAIEVPDHAFAILYDGIRHMDVETTSASGFNPARDPAAVQKFEKLTGYRYIPDKHRDQRREIDQVGLAAVIYYNHGVLLTKQHQYREALLAYFRAMSLDPEFSSAAKNALAVLANWGHALAKEGKWQAALDVVNAGLTLAPNDALLTNNHAAIWSQWAIATIDAGRTDEAIGILNRAAAAVPKGGFMAMQSLIYIKPGEALVRAGKWEAAFALGQEGLNKLDPEPQRELTRWRDALHLRWFDAEYRARHYDAAADVLAKGMEQAPSDPRILQNAAFLTQEWSKQAASDQGFAAGLAVAAKLTQRFPDAKPVKQASRDFVRRAVLQGAQAGRYQEALDTLEQGSGLLAGDDAAEVGANVFDLQAKARIKEGAWPDAADAYAHGLARYPTAGLLLNNIRWMAQEWQKAAYASGGAAASAEAARALTVKFPAVPAVREAASQQGRRVVAQEVTAGRFPEAVQRLKEADPLLTEQDRQSLGELIYDTWAKQRMSAKDWAGAADVYADALAQVGATSLLTNNVAYLAEQWARAAYASDGMQPAVDAVKQMSARFPSVRGLSSVGGNVAWVIVKDLAGAGRFDGLGPALEQVASLAQPSDMTRITEYAYDQWARSFMAKKDWAGAIQIYDTGLEKLPNSTLLKKNKAYCAQFLKG